MDELLCEEFNNELDVYKFINKISVDRLVRVIAILPLSGPKEGRFVLSYKFVGNNRNERKIYL